VRKLPITLTHSGCAPANSARDIARRSASPSHPGQTPPRRLLLPVRPRVGPMIPHGAARPRDASRGQDTKAQAGCRSEKAQGTLIDKMPRSRAPPRARLFAEGRARAGRRRDHATVRRETSCEKPDISLGLEFRRKDRSQGDRLIHCGEVRAHMPEITNKSEEQKVAEA
jgi:hypothetical protein